MAKNRPKNDENGTERPNSAEVQGACYALSLTVENVRCFGPKQTLDLSDGTGRPAQWTIILGENGTGKTTLLQAIVSFEVIEAARFESAGEPEKRSVRLPRLFAFRLHNPLSAREVEPSGFPRVGQSDSKAQCWVECILAHGLKSPTPSQAVEAHWELEPNGGGSGSFSPLSVLAYGAGRRLGNASLSSATRDDAAGTLFDEHATLRNAEEWLLRLDYASSKPSEVRDQQRHRLEQIKHLLISILPEVEDIRFTMTSGPNPTPRVEFQTFSGWVPLRRLGYGYQTLIAWVTDFASRMVERYPDSPDPLKEPAIVVVDEIDLHLHPTWQRKLIGFLSERFPNTQFIATAHSPLVVQAAENANLAVLKRVGDHVEIVNDVDEIRGWRVEQILTSDLFGLKTAWPPEVEALFTRKDALLAKAKRTAADDKELKELQTRIDRLPVGDTAESTKAMDAVRKALDLLKGSAPK